MMDGLYSKGEDKNWTSVIVPWSGMMYGESVSGWSGW